MTEHIVSDLLRNGRSGHEPCEAAINSSGEGRRDGGVHRGDLHGHADGRGHGGTVESRVTHDGRGGASGAAGEEGWSE